MQRDTIYALATPTPSRGQPGAISVIRLSGQRAAEALVFLTERKAFERGHSARDPALPPPRHMAVRPVLDPLSGEAIDRGLVVWFEAPFTETGETMAELHLHGGRAVVAGALAAIGKLGFCRPAEPGEFTRRAFLNGRMDLTAAEGVADLIAAETEAQRRQALRQADGALAALTGGWAMRLTRLLAHQEAAIEFAEDDLPTDLGDQARAGAAALRREIEAHLADGGRGERLREGLRVAILGAPNAGKSSLLNALAGREAAIVSARAGTTRDVVEVRLDLGGVPVTLADTAGLREARDEIEQEGIRRARRRAEEADLVLAVFAADVAPDAETLAWVKPGTLVLANKVDLAPGPAAIHGEAPLAISARSGAGLDELRARLTEAAARLAGTGDAALLTRPRHRAALTEAAAWLTEAEAAMLPELVSEALRAALRALGRLTGQVGVEDLLDIVFRDFCIGK